MQPSLVREWLAAMDQPALHWQLLQQSQSGWLAGLLASAATPLSRTQARAVSPLLAAAAAHALRQLLCPALKTTRLFACAPLTETTPPCRRRHILAALQGRSVWCTPPATPKKFDDKQQSRTYQGVCVWRALCGHSSARPATRYVPHQALHISRALQCADTQHW
jgi:hypothetical protein